MAVSRPALRRPALAAAALIAVALNLRIAIAAVPPVLSAIRRDTGLSSAGTGLLTAVPIMCFGAFALTAPRLIRRFGMAPLLAATMVAVAAGSAIRLAAPTAALFAGTAVIGAGIALGNVLLPGLIKQDFATRVTIMMALYSVSLYVGPAFAAGFTVPIEHATGLGWRPVVAIWGAAAVVALVAWSPFVRSAEPKGNVPAPPPSPVRGLWADPLAWQVTVFMGLQSFEYYAMLNWIPTIFEDHGLTTAQAGWLLSFSTFPGMAGALITPFLVRRLHPPVLVVTAVVLNAGAFTGLITAPVGGAYLWMVLLGLGQGISIALALGFIVARAPDSHHAAHLSTMAQGVGYLIAWTGPFLLGALRGATGGWTVPIIVLAVVLVPLLIAGLGACRDRHVLEARRSHGEVPVEVAAP
jgi:CP family cyanate transporter-like MFS transporter